MKNLLFFSNAVAKPLLFYKRFFFFKSLSARTKLAILFCRSALFSSLGRTEGLFPRLKTPNDLTSTPLVSKSRSNEELADKVGESREQIRRFIRLTELVPEILQMVDEKQIAFRPAVEISYLAEEQQYTLLEAMSYNDATPSLAQAIKMKKFNQDGKLTDEVIQSIMEEEKPNQKEKPAFRDERITKLIPKTVPKGQETDFVVKALEFYTRHLQRNKAHER